ncbi:MAG: flagellin, partial [Planctomycetota bacterium]|nr:flagellin [Planctomycetota bacterium]
MSLRINTNTQALYGHRQMQKNDFAITKSLEKLSSGLKINRAADGAAGLIISEQLRAQLGGLKQAMDNTEQAIALVQTAEGALDEMNALLAKAKKLALSSMSDATSDLAQRQANDIEFQNIVSSLQRIATQTQYAQNGLLSGAFSAGLNVQLGAFGGQTASVSIANMLAIVNSAFVNQGLSSATSATSALDNIEAAIVAVSTQRGRLGALQANVLETTLNSLRVSYENLRAAESTVRDADFAEESANFTRNTILVQSAT